MDEASEALALRAVFRRLRHRLGVAAGFFVLHRWPWPLWRIKGGGTLPIGPECFWFHALSRPQHVWWAHETHRGTWEQPIIDALARALKPGDVFVDLGAYVGPFTLLASRLVGPQGKVIAFEPDPMTRSVLERNLATNDVSNVEVVPYAVGPSAGTVRFVASGNSAGRIGADGDLEVYQVSLDEYCTEHGVRPTVMKVDIEGGEVAALERSVVARQVRELVLEVHEPQLRAQGMDPGAFLAGLGRHQLLESSDTGNYGVLVKPRAGE